MISPYPQLCTYCVYDLCTPASRLQFDTGGGDMLEPPPSVQPGHPMIEWALENLPQTKRAILNSETYVGITADMAFRGTSLCHAHLWRAVEAFRHDNPRSLWW